MRGSAHEDVSGIDCKNEWLIRKDQEWMPPKIEEENMPDRTRVTLSFEKVAIKSGDKKVAIKSGDKKAAITPRTRQHMDKIAAFMHEDKKYSAGELEGVIDIGKTRLREFLSQMVEEGLIVSEGERKQRVYFVNKGKTNKFA